jgi:hypothetical protein
VSKATFPLPALGLQLDRIRDDVYHGRGFAILRGLDVDSFSEKELVIVYLGITSYVAETRGKQNQRGDMLGAFPDDTQATPSPLSQFSPILF